MPSVQSFRLAIALRTHARRGSPLDSRRDRRTLGDIARKPDVILRRWRDLFFVRVEVKSGVKFRLAGEQVLHTRLVVEGLVGLRLIIGEDVQKPLRTLDGSYRTGAIPIELEYIPMRPLN